ncbi:helix-turn-helix domain-containing protein [Flavobacterium sp. S87F.05.LMB.W.Kidney.N]|uniref:helix-turn-helix domain-containing protein n=1 Tax=Flavobacterium sp. S87F.05.LMB.W.Kidney.N TaxID=1278758 RepID=UPI001066A432|nr:AraC family transcriptional regulator [Flavobacterium sp. S87F.05.LMB.W.Kidney.N]TDX12840.1 helix-turn-helix protein [Flavobacterium sp. S87F.05.LMB.W.Kidney.N]
MSPIENKFVKINSVSELHKLMRLPKPKHPLVSLISYNDVQYDAIDNSIKAILNFYTVSIKHNADCKFNYGQNYYDFDEGVLAFMEPGQIASGTQNGNRSADGWLLVFHPDLIRNYPIGKNIKNYGFFSYAINEALHLSESEEAMLGEIFKNIEKEYNHSIDQFSQDVMVSQIELLLNYSNRFYNRQFITRKTASSDLLTKMEILLDEYFESRKILETGLPTVHFFAEKLNLSPNYLSDMLRTITGQSTQQHIHNKLIEKAKAALSTTNLSVSEIAYQLGFEHPQSFSKLFKTKMNVTPLEYRASFN